MSLEWPVTSFQISKEEMTIIKCIEHILPPTEWRVHVIYHIGQKLEWYKLEPVALITCV